MEEGVNMNTLSDIREMLEEHIGSRVEITVNGKRNKTEVFTGVITEVYNSVFVVEIDVDGEQFERHSYNYTDVLTKTIELKFI